MSENHDAKPFKAPVVIKPRPEIDQLVEALVAVIFEAALSNPDHADNGAAQAANVFNITLQVQDNLSAKVRHEVYRQLQGGLR